MAEKINIHLNGKPQTFEAEIETSALEVIRDQAGLTGAKLVCGSGACGACAVLVDGEARCACIMPAIAMEGKSIVTIEGQGTEEKLHPVQKAFIAHDGLQCGYCTPGFINEGIAFYNIWRKENGNSRPTRDQIAAALAGHYCRCGAYQGIYEAMMDACEGKFDADAELEYLRKDAPEKVTGAAKYTTDIQLPGQLIGVIFRASIPRGTITKLDLSAATSISGVKAAIRLSSSDKVNFAGQALAAIAAESHEIAKKALKAVELEITPLPFQLDLQKSMAADAFSIFESKDEVGAASEAPPFPGSWEGNVRKTAISISSSKSGKAKRSIEKADKNESTHFAGKFFTPTQLHTCLEPHCAVADWNSEGNLTVYASTQSVYYLAKKLEETYGLKEENVKVKADYIGGAFGSKLTFYTAIRAAVELSRAAKAPVAVIYDRAEELSETGFRPPSMIDFDITAEKDGSQAAYTMQSYGNSGYAIGSNNADISGLGYPGLAKSLQDFDVLTNFQPGAAFRGPGGPAACFVLEQGIDQLAYQLGMDPLAFRRQWETHEGYISLFDWVQKLGIWKDRKPKPDTNQRFKRGVGLAFGAWMHLYMPIAEVELFADSSGLTVSQAVQDMGQGARSVLAKAVSDVFGIPISAIKVAAGDSSLSIGPTSGGSRTTASIYPAAFEAAEMMQKEILKALKKDLEGAFISKNGIEYVGGTLTWTEAFKRIPPLQVKAKRGHNSGFNPMGLLPLGEGMELGQNRSYGCYVIEVEVDTWLGKTRVLQVFGAMRVGKIHVKPLAESQCYGGVIQGIGHALYEDRALCPKRGIILTRGLEDYRIPGIGDMPQVKIDFIEEGFDMVKQKGIGLAELCTTPVAGAIANAIFNATGYRPMSAPITPENMLAGLKSIQG